MSSWGIYGGGPPMGGHGGSDPGGDKFDSGWMSGSMGSTPPKKKRPNLLFWVILFLLVCALWLIFG